MSTSHRIVLFANGDLPHREDALEKIHPEDFILCADGGAIHALAMGLRPNLVIGDLDSLDQDDITRLEKLNCKIESYPVDKDATDLELALQASQRIGRTEVLVLGALGGRWDQTFANLLLLASQPFADLQISLTDGRQTAWIVRTRLEIRGEPGDIVSTLALSLEVSGLTYHQGLRWPLRDFTLSFGSTRGISNEMTSECALITLQRGILLVTHIPVSFPINTTE